MNIELRTRALKWWKLLDANQKIEFHKKSGIFPHWDTALIAASTSAITRIFQKLFDTYNVSKSSKGWIVSNTEIKYFVRDENHWYKPEDIQKAFENGYFTEGRVFTDGNMINAFINID